MAEKENSVIKNTAMPNQSGFLSIKDLPSDDRPREKLMRCGAEMLSNAELAAIIIGSGARGMSAVELSRRIMKRYDGQLDTFLKVSVQELADDPELKGLGTSKACKLIAAAELGRRISIRSKKLRNLNSSEEAEAYLTEAMRFYTQEHFDVLLIDTKGHLIKHETVSVGTINASVVHPREVFCRAVKLQAYGVILAHNHPSGDPTPSAEDIKTTKNMIECGRILGIPVIDHIIVGDGNALSLRRAQICKF